MRHGDHWGTKILPADKVINVTSITGSRVISARARITSRARMRPRIASETSQPQPGNPGHGSPTPPEHLPACPANRHSHPTKATRARLSLYLTVVTLIPPGRLPLQFTRDFPAHREPGYRHAEHGFRAAARIGVHGRPDVHRCDTGILARPPATAALSAASDGHQADRPGRLRRWRASPVRFHAGSYPPRWRPGHPRAPGTTIRVLRRTGSAA